MSSFTIPSVLPAGTLIDFAGTVAPVGFLICPAVQTNVSRTVYAALFAAIGTTWGVGDGATTFGMPWFPVDNVALQSSGNVGTSSVGSVISHTHGGIPVILSPTMTSAGGSTPYPSGGYANSAATGGTQNLAAGVRVLKCVKI